jgi:hypothetical protein
MCDFRRRLTLPPYNRTLIPFVIWRPMKIQHLRCFINVAAKGGMPAAADVGVHKCC